MSPRQQGQPLRLSRLSSQSGATTGGGGVPAQNFLDLSAGVVLPALNIPLVLEFEMPCDFIRGEFLTSAVNTTVTIVLAAYAS